MRRRNRKKKLCLFLLVILFILLMILILFELRLRPLVLNAARSRARLYASEVIAVCVDDALNSLPDGQKLIEVVYGDVGVSSIETNIAALNRVRSDSIRNIAGDVSDIDKMTLSVPIGNLIGSNLLTGRGASVGIRLVPIGDVAAELYSEFIESGVNQTMHRIYLRVRVAMNMLVGWDTVKLELSNDVILAETIIVGEVPDAYTAINRFEIDENEENDLNDYAATLP